MKWFKFYLFLIMTLSGAGMTRLYAQDHAHSTGHSPAHKFGFYAGYTRIPSAFYEHETQLTSTGKYVPTLGLEYWYRAAEHWELGMMADIEIDEYFVQSEGRLLERNNALILAMISKFKPYKGLGILVGPGYEWEFKSDPDEFWVFRAGVEYELPLGNHWELIPDLTFDIKEHYSTWSTGLSVCKTF